MGTNGLFGFSVLSFRIKLIYHNKVISHMAKNNWEC